MPYTGGGGVLYRAILVILPYTGGGGGPVQDSTGTKTLPGVVCSVRALLLLIAALWPGPEPLKKKGAARAAAPKIGPNGGQTHPPDKAENARHGPGSVTPHVGQGTLVASEGGGSEPHSRVRRTRHPHAKQRDRPPPRPK